VAVGRAQPDRTYVLDVPASVGLARVATRGAAAGEAPDRFEQDGAALHEARRRAFLEIAVRNPDRCAVIDANRSEDAVAEAIWADVETHLMGKTARREGG
jgi:dTMP kinase